jgi:hypothetical protein
MLTYFVIIGFLTSSVGVLMIVAWIYLGYHILTQKELN